MYSFKNTWGSANGLNQQRADLFKVVLAFPSALGGTGVWERECAFAVEDFPFPARTRETIQVKYLNQTNHNLGAETATSPLDIKVRYAFDARTVELLERWHWMTSNPKTGSVGLTSSIKTNGKFVCLVPNPAATNEHDAFVPGGTYILEGCMVKGFSPSHASMTENGLVSCTLSLSIDRYYPKSPSDLYVIPTNAEYSIPQ